MSADENKNIIVSSDVEPPDLAAAAGAAAVTAYTQLVGPNFLTEQTFNWGMSEPDMVWRTNLCNRVSDLMVAALSPEHEAMTEYHKGWDIPGVATLFFHAIVALKDRNFIIDGTWQRMVMWQNHLAEPGTPPVELPLDAPLILAGTRRAVVEKARGYGITNERILDLWRKRGAAKPPKMPKSFPAS